MRNHMKRHALSFAAAVALVLGGGMQLCAAEKLADTVYYNGKIYTITEDYKSPKSLDTPNTAEVVATLNGQIIFVGSKADAEAAGYFKSGTDINLVDLKGKTMLPGFVDGHGHFPAQGSADITQVNLNSPPIGKMNSIKEYVVALEKKAATTAPGALVLGWGYDDTLVEEQKHPSQEDLNLSTGHPVILTHTSEHIKAANTQAIINAGLSDDMINDKGVLVFKGKEYPTVDTVQKADGTWHLYGVFRETAAMSLLTGDTIPNKEEKITDSSLKSVARASEIYTAAGVTTADQGGSMLNYTTLRDKQGNLLDNPVHSAFALGELQNALDKGAMTPRVIAHPFGVYFAGPDDLAPYQRMALGWTGKNYTVKGDDVPDMGADITSFKLKTDSNGGSNYYPSIEAFQYVPENLPKDYIFLGAWKMIYDGSNQGYTGFFKKPGYYDPAYGGYSEGYTGADALTFGSTPEDSFQYLKDHIDLYHRNEDSVEVHTNGNAAAEHYVTAMEEVVAANPEIKDTRDCAIHAQMMERQHIERLMGLYDTLDTTKDMYTDLSGTAVDTVLRDKLGNGELMKRQNFINSYFIGHTFFWGDRHMEIFMGPGNAKNMNPAGWSMAYNQMISFHNDTKVTPISPLRNLQSAVERLSSPTLLGKLGETANGGTKIYGEGKNLDGKATYAATKGGEQKQFWDYDQRINVLQALHALTIIPAYQNHLEGKIGSIKASKLADFVILDEDPFTTDASRLASIRVATTIVNDKPVYGILPGSTTFTSQLTASYEQPAGVSVSDVRPEPVSEEALAALPKGMKSLGAYRLSAKVTPAGSSAIYQMHVLGNGSSVDDYALYALGSTATPFTYGKPETKEAMSSADGQWWMATIDDPLTALPKGTTLDESQIYVVFFAIADDGPYDLLNGEPEKTDSTIALATSGSLPTNSTVSASSGGGSSGGCTVGSAPAYDLLALFLAFSAVAVVRVVRRRED